MFLHGNFEHVFFNSFATLVLGSTLEYSFGWFRLMLVYLSAGFVGNLMSACVHHPEMTGVGASTSIFGLLACLWSYIFLNWQALGRLGKDVRCTLFCLYSMIIAIIFSMSMFPMLSIGKDDDSSKDA